MADQFFGRFSGSAVTFDLPKAIYLAIPAKMVIIPQTKSYEDQFLRTNTLSILS